jgi:hypothetical protein
MKFIKGMGIAIMLIAFICALIFTGRIEGEEIEFKRGELISSQMTSDEDIWRTAGHLIISLVCGGIIYGVGTAMELAVEKRRERESWFDDDEEIY